RGRGHRHADRAPDGAAHIEPGHVTHGPGCAQPDRPPATKPAGPHPAEPGKHPDGRRSMSRRALPKPWSRRTSRRSTRLGVLVTSVFSLWLGGLILFVGQIPQAVDGPTDSTDAIVVLTGGSDRVQEGLRLIAENRARKLFISGVHEGVNLTALLQSMAQISETMPAPEQIACCVVLGHSADDTEGNARETASWMAAQNFRSLRLVTADYHMPRSLLEFRRAMPDLIIRP